MEDTGRGIGAVVAAVVVVMMVVAAVGGGGGGVGDVAKRTISRILFTLRK